jgi:osmotically-inducible protein OsmY
MKIKVLAVLGLAAVAGLAGCRSAANTNTTVTTNANTGMMNANVTMATPMSTPMPAADTATQKIVEDALKKGGLNDVTVSATTTEVTLRGTVAKGKLGEAVRIATDASKGKRVINQVSEK